MNSNDFFKVVLDEDNKLTLILENEELIRVTGECGEEGLAILKELIEHITLRTNDLTVLAQMKVDVKSE